MRPSLRKRFRLTSLVGRVYNVDGHAVRRKHTVMIGGGHSLVYRWIPAGEVWIERMRGGRRDERFILAHELTEIVLMRVRGWSYDRAHDAANAVERRLRIGDDPSATFARFVAKHFPRAAPRAAVALRSALLSAFRRY